MSDYEILMTTGTITPERYELAMDSHGTYLHFVKYGKVLYCSEAAEWDHYGEPGTGMGECPHIPVSLDGGKDDGGVFTDLNSARRAVCLGQSWAVPPLESGDIEAR